MSIATLKRKTAAKYNNSSVGQEHFSLNGTRRSQGYVGQGNRGRYLSRTLMRDGAAKGHGGCCGTYDSKMLSTGICCLNDTDVIKLSSMNNLGQLMTRYKWINSGKGTVKVDSNQDTYSSNSYTNKLRNSKIYEAETCLEPSVKPPVCKPDVPMSINTLACNMTKDITRIEGGTAMDSSLYILGLAKKCTSNDPNPVSSTTCGPLPGN
jgi:hypothetical protein